MARDFSFGDARKCIKIIRTTKKELDTISDYKRRKARDINAVFSTLNSSGVFSRCANDEILNKTEGDFSTNENYKRLILSLNQYISSSYVVNHSKELIQQIKQDTDEDIAVLNAGLNPLKWLFLSKQNKQNASEAYERLSEYANSYIIEDSNDIINSASKLPSITFESANDHFVYNKDVYEAAIKEIVKQPDTMSKIKAIDDLLKRYGAFDSYVNFVKNDFSKEADVIKRAIDRLIASNLLEMLKGISVEEIGRDKKRIRIKPLIEAGFLTVADVFTANEYNLASLYGVSADNAHTIKRIADNYAQQAKNDIKIKLSYDDKNKEATNIVKALCLYRKKDRYVKEIDAVKSKNSNRINRAVDAFNEVGSGRFWAFYDDAYKSQIRSFFCDFEDVVFGEYGQTISNATNSYKSLPAEVSAEDAWNDFRDNSIDFYNIIEKIYPGVLGTNDLLYGLPEDLAREIQDECFFPDGLLCTLRRYQEWGVKYILHQERVLLGDEMGLGKTVQAIATMVSLKNTGATHFAVVCPASVITNWCREIVKHSKLKVIKAHGSTKASAARAWIKTGGVIVTTYESTSAIKLDPYFRFSQLIVDEAHYIKNKGAARTTRTIELSKHADRVLFMTGTALENRVEEMISLIEVLRPNIASSIASIAFMSTAPQFREKIAPVYYRRKREDVLTELPEKIESEEWCTLSGEEERAYEEAVLSKNYMASRRLSWNVDDLKKSSKMNRLKEIVEDAKNDDRKILVFSFFLDTIEKITHELGSKICLNPINGAVTPNRRQEIIDEFEKAPAGTVLCAQIQSGGTGLNIQAASVVIICEPQLKPSIENQAISRAYRMGQSRNVQVFRLLCVNTIDEKIMDLLKEKQAAFDAFADKSVAAQSVEIDNNTLGDIIKDEIDRINKKRKEQQE